MVLMRRSVSFIRFLVDDPPPGNYLEIFPEKIARHAFRSIDENSLQERSEGGVLRWIRGEKAGGSAE